MTLMRAINRLKRQLGIGHDGRCPACRGRVILVRVRKSSPDSPAVPSSPRDDPKPCPVCGWKPEVITEVVVKTREEARALLALHRMPIEDILADPQACDRVTDFLERVTGEDGDPGRGK